MFSTEVLLLAPKGMFLDISLHSFKISTTTYSKIRDDSCLNYFFFFFLVLLVFVTGFLAGTFGAGAGSGGAFLMRITSL